MSDQISRTLSVDPWSKLAALRFVLASIVAFNHLAEMMPIGVFTVIPMLGTFEAILGFLLVSGYSIGVSYRKEPEQFLWRRIKRIYPVYLASLVLMGIVLYTGSQALPAASEWIVNLLFLNQLVVPTSIVGPAWSLSLEFWLYCLTPLLFTLSDKTVKRLVAVSFIAFCAYTCGRTLFHWTYYSGTAFGLNLLLLAFIWLSGMRLARNRDISGSHDGNGNIMRSIAAMFAIYIALSISIQAGYRFKHGEMAQFVQSDLISFILRMCTLAAVVVLFRNILRQGSGGRPSAWMRMLGDVSFPLYMLHIPVFELLKRTSIQSPAMYFAVAFGVSVVAYRALDLYSQRRHAPRKMPVAA
ncbi:acyltransferase family protein [Variovorax sp. RHLX14]|uniref:acyltransferase family protein n=1 Tax=Variovorax sp. RHLX14 TaxID=1259731 RepID=UPI003F47716D